MAVMRTTFLSLLFVVLLAGSAYPFCFDEAGVEYGISPLILRAIAKVESNYDPRALNRNRNGSYDFGLMQINSSWASVLGKDRWNALGDACYNTKTGAWILANCMNKYGYSWQAIGCYNSRTPSLRDRYALAVFKQLQRIERTESAVSERRGAEGGNERRTEPYVGVSPEVLRTPPAVPLREQAVASGPQGDGTGSVVTETGRID